MAAIAVAGSAYAQTPVERGSYLVNGILTCGNCHTPRGPGGVWDMSKQLSGGPRTWDELTFKAKGANITPDLATGIGKWSDADIKRSLLAGVRPNGTQIAPMMPYGFYKVFTPADIDAVVAYLKSVSAVSNAVEPPVYKAAMHVDTPPGADKAMSEADIADPVKRGFYLATIGHCMECHTPLVKDVHDYAQLGKGGQPFPGPWGVTISRNITSHATAGLGAWSDAEIKAAITQGLHRDGTKLKPPMAFSLYATMTDQDLGAIVAYLRTVPPKE
ncbi:MAG TPA: c-type cytochrome [Casimicrobiaceae bacterium]|nr:c-type cytochrome [Casimicrobiaceae bacterium]